MNDGHFKRNINATAYLTFSAFSPFFYFYVTYKAAKMADATDCHGNWIFSGPDGIKPFSRYKLRDTSYIGHVGYSWERSSDVKHMWRAPWWSVSKTAKTGWVGAIGWNTWSYNDWRVLKSGHQISTGPFRTATAHRMKEFTNDSLSCTEFKQQFPYTVSEGLNGSNRQLLNGPKI